MSQWSLALVLNSPWNWDTGSRQVSPPFCRDLTNSFLLDTLRCPRGAQGWHVNTSRCAQLCAVHASSCHTYTCIMDGEEAYYVVSENRQIWVLDLDMTPWRFLIVNTTTLTFILSSMMRKCPPHRKLQIRTDWKTDYTHTHSAPTSFQGDGMS